MNMPLEISRKENSTFVSFEMAVFEAGGGPWLKQKTKVIDGARQRSANKGIVLLCLVHDLSDDVLHRPPKTIVCQIAVYVAHSQHPEKLAGGNQSGCKEFKRQQK